MDYRALAELIMLSSFGLATLVFVTGLSIRLFLAPTLRELLDPRKAQDAERRLLEARLTQIEDRLDGVEMLGRPITPEDFDRQLEAPKLRSR